MGSTKDRRDFVAPVHLTDELLKSPAAGCLTVAAIPGGLLWCVDGLSKGDYSFAGGVWAGPVLSIAALVFTYWGASTIDLPDE